MFGDLRSQIDWACEYLQKQEENLSKGFTLVGYSLGSIISWGILEDCPIGKYVKRYISIGGVHNGIAFIPKVPSWGFLQRAIYNLCYYLFGKLIVGCQLLKPVNDPSYVKTGFVLP